MQMTPQILIQPSPVAFAQSKLAPRMGQVHGMAVALGFGDSEGEKTRKAVLGVCDASCLPRFGVKGSGALQWLTAHKVMTPEQANGWRRDDSGAMVLRLGNSEFLIEDRPDTQVCNSLKEDQQKRFGVYKVQRYDASLILSGSKVGALLSELCTLDLRETALADNGLVMTQMAGISVTVLRQTLNGEPVYRLWCDGTYGSYMWETLVELAQELGGGAVGLSCHFQEIS